MMMMMMMMMTHLDALAGANNLGGGYRPGTQN
jgi:hypothetical protein